MYTPSYSGIRPARTTFAESELVWCNFTQCERTDDCVVYTLFVSSNKAGAMLRFRQRHPLFCADQVAELVQHFVCVHWKFLACRPLSDAIQRHKELMRTGWTEEGVSGWLPKQENGEQKFKRGRWTGEQRAREDNVKQRCSNRPNDLKSTL